jgi:hypothetical protein
VRVLEVEILEAIARDVLGPLWCCFLGRFSEVEAGPFR